jgi:segregation and condensation protein A
VFVGAPFFDLLSFMEYHFQSEKFSGPLEKLLGLIEEQKLGIDDVSLAKVTDGFLKYLDEFRKNGGTEDVAAFRGDLRVLADFIAIASRLILLKSKYLMPGLPLTEEEASDIKDLEARLAQYRVIRPAILILAKLWRESHKSYSRPYFLGRGTGFSAGPSVFYPGTNVNAQALADSLRRIFDSVVTYELETETIKEKIVSLEEKIKDVLARITAGGDSKLADLSGEKTRADLVVVFLAILHLAREQLVRLEQTDRFSDIMVRKNSATPTNY